MQSRLDIVSISPAKPRGLGTVKSNGEWKISYSGVVAAMSAQAGVGLLVSPNIAECVVDGVVGRPAIRRKGLSYGPKAKTAKAISVFLVGVLTLYRINGRSLTTRS